MSTFQRRDMGPIASVEGFIAALFRLRGEYPNDKVWFRGHGSSDYKLLPTIGREHEYGGRRKMFTPKDEKDLLHRFRRRGYPHDSRMINAGEALFLARHHGLPTR